ncbi:MAG: tetratricopeptide repeat protein [Bacteroidia bacterium]
MRILLTTLAVLLAVLLPAQKLKLDSLRELLHHPLSDTEKVNVLAKTAKELRRKGLLKQAMDTAQLTITLGKKSGFAEGQMKGWDALGRIQETQGHYADGYKSYESGLKIALETKSRLTGAFYEGMGNCQMDLSRYDEALKEYQAGLAAGQASGNQEIIIHCYNNSGMIYMNQGKYPEALRNFIEASGLAEKTGNKKSQAHDYYLIASVYYYQNSLDLALENYNKCVKLYLDIGYKDDLGPVYTNLGVVNRQLGHPEEALKNYTEALQIEQAMGDKRSIAETLLHLGVLNRQLKKYEEAVKQIQEAQKVTVEIKEEGNYTEACFELGLCWMEMGKMPEAIQSLQTSLTLASKLKIPISVKSANEGLSEVYARLHDYEKAYRYFRRGAALNDSLLNQDNNKQIADMNVRYQSEKKDRELKLNAVEIRNQKIESEKKQTQLIAVLAGLVLAVICALLILRGYGQIKKAHRIIGMQKLLVEEKNKDITDSINYAKRIQEAILSSGTYLTGLFPESFLLFKSKDIVSGDFYWFSEKNGIKLIAAVDCTGHGVPGAFMSMIGNAFLNEIVNEKGITAPALILSELREMIISSLKQKESNNKDGMDISLLMIDEQQHIIRFAGANNPIWRNTNEEGKPCLKEYKASKQPIGQGGGEQLPFEEHSIPYCKGDWFYLFTDGYADQFGGPRGKKFKYKPFQDLLLLNASQNSNVQKLKLEEAFDNWKQGFEQVDDVLVIGIQI